jgi:hypothetical protein
LPRFPQGSLTGCVSISKAMFGPAPETASIVILLKEVCSEKSSFRNRFPTSLSVAQNETDFS